MIGKGIKIVREIIGLPQGVLIKRLGTSQSYMSQIENDVVTPSFNKFNEIAEGMETNPVVLYWFGLQREEVKESCRVKFDILKPSVDELFKEIFFSENEN